jgi:hypothetical protein
MLALRHDLRCGSGLPDQRADLLNGLDVLASQPQVTVPIGTDDRWPDLTNAVYWIVDNIWWASREPHGSVWSFRSSARSELCLNS